MRIISERNENEEINLSAADRPTEKGGSLDPKNSERNKRKEYKIAKFGFWKDRKAKGWKDKGTAVWSGASKGSRASVAESACFAERSDLLSRSAGDSLRV